MSSRALLALFVYWAIDRAYTVDKVRGQDVLQAFCESALSPQCCALHASAPVNAILLCGGSEDKCVHLRSAEEEWENHTPAPPQTLWARRLLTLSKKKGCKTCASLAQQMQEDGARDVSTSALEGVFLQNPTQAAALPRDDAKKRRVDSHLRDQVLARQAKARVSSQGEVDIGASVPRGTEWHWVYGSLRKHLGASLVGFQRCTQIGIALDGTRLGHPAKEYIVYNCLNLDTQKSTWLPPQVAWVRARKG